MNHKERLLNGFIVYLIMSLFAAAVTEPIMTAGVMVLSYVFGLFTELLFDYTPRDLLEKLLQVVEK